MGKRLTSRYTLVIHEVTTTVKVWVGALLPSLGKPNNWQLVVKKLLLKKIGRTKPVNRYK